MFIYNSLSQKKEEFKSITPGQVKMYLCGPTVYDLLHVGNFRGPIVFNLVRNWLEVLGYQVDFVYNYTDVDDRIIQRAQKDGVSAVQVSEHFIAEFEKDFKNLKLRPHTHNPKVTDYIPQILMMVADIVDAGCGYVREGEVLFSVRDFPAYGKLSNKNIDELQIGARVDIKSTKRDPLDFSLWKPAKAGEPKWSSPWGDGRPGWHIECSAMAKSILGEQIDIHAGGLDLIFPHHENEIAQTESVTHKSFARYWMHNNMINFGSQKMSKSLGNIKTAREFLSTYNAEILKFLILSSHYRSVADFSEKQILQSISGLARIYSSLSLANTFVQEPANVAVEPSFAAAIKEQDDEIRKALNDDFNSPEVFAALYTLVRKFNTLFNRNSKRTPAASATSQAFIDFFRKKGELMSLFQEDFDPFLTSLDDMLLLKMNLRRTAIQEKVDERSQARANKDWKKSDELRDELKKIGIALHDGTNGTHWEVEK